MVICTRMKAVEAVRFWAYFIGDTNMACCLITYRLREKRQLCFIDRASSLQHFWHFGPDKFLLGKSSWCSEGCLVRSLASVPWIDVPLSFPSNLWEWKMPFRHFIHWEMKFNYRKPPVFPLMWLRNGILPAISVNNRCHIHQLLRMVSLSLSPEEMKERNKECLPSSRHQGLSP